MTTLVKHPLLNHSTPSNVSRQLNHLQHAAHYDYEWVAAHASNATHTSSNVIIWTLITLLYSITMSKLHPGLSRRTEVALDA